MKKYKFGTCGYYDTQNTIPNGQTIRTISVTNAIKDAIGSEEVYSISSHIWRKKPFAFFISLIKLAKESKNVVVFPDQNGIKVIVPILIMTRAFTNCQIYYVVIGGWLPKCLKKHSWLTYFIKKLNGLFVQTSTLKNELEGIGINKVKTFPNFKKMEILASETLSYEHSKPYKICFFSRIIEKKGIEELIEGVKNINGELNETIYMLDIYGPVDVDYQERFGEMKKHFPENIQYCGVVDSLKTVDTLKDYFLQVFPTKYKTEGFPGSILDSFCAGVPVLAARWNSWNDVITEGENGITFEIENFGDMVSKLKDIAENPSLIIDMKANCIETALQLRPEKVIQILLNEVLYDNKKGGVKCEDNK